MFVEYIGVSQNLPNEISFFKEELVTTTFKLKEELKDVLKIISVSVDVEIKSMKLINTDVRTSNEGQRLSGKKLLVETNFKFRIKYLSDSKEKYLYLLKSSMSKVIYVVLPREYENYKIEDIARKKAIGVKIYIEDIFSKPRSNREIYIRNLVLVDVFVKKNLIY